MLEQRFSDNEPTNRDIPSFIEPMPPLISNPFMRPRPQKGTNLLELFEEDSESEEPELVQVYLRLKPYHARNNLYEVRSNRCLITSVDTATAGHGRRTQHNVSKMYTFSHIFGAEVTQKEIFDHVVKGNLKKLPEGHSFTLLTYGASGSGKTFTLMGTVASPGLVPRSLEYVFRVVDAAQQPLYKPSDGGADKLSYAEQDYELQWVKRLRQISAPLRDKYRRMSVGLTSEFTTSTMDLSTRIRHYVWVSFVEIYNEGIYDLLAKDRRAAAKLRIREDTNGNVYVKDATQAFVRSGEEAYDVLVAGKHNLQVAATGVHAHSSRSHCIFTITMLTETEEGVRQSCVRLCDLAGCERARMTRNTGARMQESRAINSSLHVLERCLHTLRRKQKLRGEAVVPYRESKLTRLLGSGLSGTRGEAVSMVVTLNQAPEYAHETKHVLQLADIARDIHVNNTIAESQFENSAQDSTVSCSSEVMRLRSENERLHFELLQAQTRNKELIDAMDERQQESAKMMRELVEETKDITQQYYEAQLEALRTEMKEMAEEYESRLSKEGLPAASAGTPSRSLQNKVGQLMTELATLQTKLNEKCIALACAEEEIQHLRARIKEKDVSEKAFEEQTDAMSEEIMSLTDSDQDSDVEDDNPCNESLEPNFKKLDMSNFNLLLQPVQSQNSTQSSEDTEDNMDENEDDQYNDTLKDDSLKEANKSYDLVKNLEEAPKSANNGTIHEDQGANLSSKSNTDVRGTYFVRITDEDSCDLKDNKVSSFTRGTYFVNEKEDSAIHHSNVAEFDEINESEDKIKASGEIDDKNDVVKQSVINNNQSKLKVHEKPSTSLVTRIIRSAKSSQGKDNSLTQFEQLEMAANICDENRHEEFNEFANIKILNEVRTYFDDKPVNHVVDKNPPIKISPEAIKRNSLNIDVNKCDKKNLTKIDISEKQSSDTVQSQPFVDDDLIKISVTKQKRTYFDDIDVNAEQLHKINEHFKDLNVQNDAGRSPSIVKDDVGPTDSFESSTIKKLLGESFSKPDIKCSVQKTEFCMKKHKSVDIFEGFDSPQVAKSQDIINVVEKARQSIEKLVLEQKSSTKVQNNMTREVNTENVSILDAAIEKPDRILALSNPITVKEANSLVLRNATTHSCTSLYGNNTTDDFEDICKDLTTSRATEFDLLAQEFDDKACNQNSNVAPKLKDIIQAENTEVDFNKDVYKSGLFDVKDSESEDLKYNLRSKTTSKYDMMDSQAKCEDKATSKRSLRLRRRKNQDDEKYDLDTDKKHKLKDILNLQKEFSDVVMNIPVKPKETKDILSPEKLENEEENYPPNLEVQSCPAKSVQRSRRKLFTPRIEPLDESSGPTGDSNEKLYVPRPSYHRTRVRRKL